MTHPNFIPKPPALPWWLNVITMALFCLFLSLSYWQATRGFEKQALIDKVQATSTPINEQQLLQPNYQLKIGQQVELSGQLDNEHFFLIDNKFYQGEVGYLVISPLILRDNLAILVNRGWVDRRSDIDQQFRLAPTPNTVTMTGQLYMPKHNRFITHNIVDKTWPQQALEIDTEAFAKRLNLELLPMVVNLHSDSEHSFFGPLPLDMGMKPEKHYGYSAQWMLFALILAGIRIYYRIRRVRHEPAGRQKKS